MAFSGTNNAGQSVTYIDHKRYWYLGAYITPIIIAISIWGYFASGNNPFMTLIPLIYIFGVTPLLDAVIGLDTHNPPEAVMPEMMSDNYYRFLIYPFIACLYGVFALGVWFVATQSLPFWVYPVMVVSFGLICGGVLNLAHELGHKANKTDKFMAKIASSLIGYGHFCIEHNRGHHVMVSTPEDPASSRMGENIYRFALREIPGTFVRGWRHERERLAKQGHSFWHYKNDVLQGYLITLVITGICAALFGPLILLYLIPHHIIGWYTLTQANYIEHYGLLRAKKANGKYERTQPHHSWNTNHLFSNMQLFHLQRHSDHHANPLRPYQVLRNFDELPSLPSGYLGCYALAIVPSVWYRIMDPKVLAWSGGDITKVNLDPKRKDNLLRRYGKPAAAAE